MERYLEAYVNILFPIKLLPTRLASIEESCMNQLLLWWLPNGNFLSFILPLLVIILFYKKELFLISILLSVCTGVFLFYSMCYNPLLYHWRLKSLQNWPMARENPSNPLLCLYDKLPSLCKPFFTFWHKISQVHLVLS